MQRVTFEIDGSDWKEEQRKIDCLDYVLANFDEIEPTIREFWLNKEMKELQKIKKDADYERW